MFEVDVCRMNVHIEEITLKADRCMRLSLKDRQTDKGLCSHGSQFHGMPAHLLGAVQIKTNGRGMDEIIENKNCPFFKAVVNPVGDLLISSQKQCSGARRGRQKSSRA